MSQSYRSRPSEIFGCDDALAAFYFDRAVWTWGARVQHEIQQAQNANTPTAQANKLAIVNMKWLGQVKFADPSKHKRATT
jgi:hypothetical protein